MNLTIIRGLPGSGKSTAARKMSEETGAIIIEPDMFCVEAGQYIYTPERYAAAIERSYILLEILTGAEFDRENAILRPDIIYTDVLPLAGDIAELIRHVNPQYHICLKTIKNPVDMRICNNAHAVKPRDLARMFRIFDDVQYYNGKILCAGRLYSGWEM